MKIMQYFKTLIENKKQQSIFEKMLEIRLSYENPGRSYLRSRGIEVEDLQELKCFERIAYFEGSTSYQGRTYQLAPSIVVGLFDTKNRLFGVWIREIQTKKFYIWLLDGFDKYWIPGNYSSDKPTIICEGIFDAISFYKLVDSETKSKYNIAASLGVSVSKAFKDVIIAFDNDLAGKKATLTLLEQNPGFNFLEYNFKEKDFNDFLKVYLKEKIQFKFNIVPNLIGRIRLRGIL